MFVLDDIRNRIAYFGITAKPADYRLIDYSEVNYDRSSGEIDFLKGSSIDEALFNIRPETEILAYTARNTLANMIGRQYYFAPDVSELANNASQLLDRIPKDGKFQDLASFISSARITTLKNGLKSLQPSILGYRKDLTLRFPQDGGQIITLRVLGFQGDKKTGIVTSTRSTPYISVRANGIVNTIYVSLNPHDLQFSLLANGPWEELVQNHNGSTTHSDLHPDTIYYYRARSASSSTPNPNPWSVPINVRTGS